MPHGMLLMTRALDTLPAWMWRNLSSQRREEFRRDTPRAGGMRGMGKGRGVSNAMPQHVPLVCPVGVVRGQA